MLFINGSVVNVRSSKLQNGVIRAELFGFKANNIPVYSEYVTGLKIGGEGSVEIENGALVSNIFLFMVLFGYLIQDVFM